MSTSTPRLNLELPDNSDSMRKGDSVLASNYRLIDKNIGVRYETDLALITTPYKGEFGLDTDINDVKYYDASWKWFGSASAPRGRNYLGSDFLAAENSDAGPAGTASKIHEIAVATAIVTGRRYACTITGNVFPSANTNYVPLISVKTSASTTVVGDTNLFIIDVPIHDATIGSAKAFTFTWTHYFTASDVGVGSRYFAIWMDTNAAATTTTYRYVGSTAPHYSVLLIEDVGT